MRQWTVCVIWVSRCRALVLRCLFSSAPTLAPGILSLSVTVSSAKILRKRERESSSFGGVGINRADSRLDIHPRSSCHVPGKPCPELSVDFSNVSAETGHFFSDSVTVNCDLGFVKDDGNNNVTSYDVTCDVDGNWDFTNPCTSERSQTCRDISHNRKP